MRKLAFETLLDFVRLIDALFRILAHRRSSDWQKAALRRRDATVIATRGKAIQGQRRCLMIPWLATPLRSPQ
jgi:hypothetical protein